MQNFETLLNQSTANNLTYSKLSFVWLDLILIIKLVNLLVKECFLLASTLLFWYVFDILGEEEEEKRAEVKSENVLAAVEEAYPNSLTIDDIAR